MVVCDRCGKKADEDMVRISLSIVLFNGTYGTSPVQPFDLCNHCRDELEQRLRGFLDPSLCVNEDRE